MIMTVLEILSWRIDPDSFRLHVRAVVEDAIELPRWHWDCPPEYTHGTCTASILLDDLEDWPETMEERIAFLEQFAEWFPVDEGAW